MKNTTRILALVFCILLFAALPVWAGTGDGSVVSVTKVQDNGADNLRYNIIVMGDGFQNSELTTYHTQVQDLITAFNTAVGFGPCGGSVNFYRVDIASNESGTDKPATCYGTSAYSKNTYLDTYFCAGGIQRCIGSSNMSLIQTTANNACANWDFVIVLVNDSEYGGCAWGNVTFSSVSTGFVQIALHELGHAIGDLGDEYEYGASSTTYSGSEPGAVNLTSTAGLASLKWSDLVLPTTPIPTWNQPSCSSYASPPSSWNGITGAYEGGGYYACGLFRPQPECLMRILGVPLCPVCRRKVQHVMMMYYTGPNLSITPWGAYLNPPAAPYWQTPDIWCDNNGDGVQGSDEPLINKSDNHLFARVANTGDQTSPAFLVRFSYVPFTGVIDMANRQNIATVSRPALVNGSTDVVEAMWDLTSIPPAFAGIDHFCVIVEILVDECATYDNQAQNNFCDVQTAGPAPAPVWFYIKNIYDWDAIGKVQITPAPAPWRVKANVPDLNRIPLRAKEEKLLVLEFSHPGTTQKGETRREAGGIIARRQFDVTFFLNGRMLGGVSPRITVVPSILHPSKWGFSVDAGYTFPTGHLNTLYDGSSMLGVDLEYLLCPRLYAVLLLGKNNFKGAAPGVADSYWWNLSANLKYELAHLYLRPYINGGLGLLIPKSGDPMFGYNVGAGLLRAVGPNIDAEVGMDYHRAFSDSLAFYVWHVGLIFRF
jgi:hypothetical protein